MIRALQCFIYLHVIKWSNWRFTDSTHLSWSSEYWPYYKFVIVIVYIRNLKISRAPLKSQAQGTSLFTSADFILVRHRHLVHLTYGAADELQLRSLSQNAWYCPTFTMYVTYMQIPYLSYHALHNFTRIVGVQWMCFVDESVVLFVIGSCSLVAVSWCWSDVDTLGSSGWRIPWRSHWWRGKAADAVCHSPIHHHIKRRCALIQHYFQPIIIKWLIGFSIFV